MKPAVRVAIVTSDGYEAWGRATDPVGAATDYMLVDAFTRFLEKRVFTQNMALLRRMVAEYFCHCETTVREFVAQCSSQISVGPFENEDPETVAAAARVLHDPRSFARSGLSASVFTFLVSKLRTARAPLLMQFFVEFCQGNDAALCAFIEQREGFVSILPLAAPRLENAPFPSPDGIPFESADPVPMPPLPVSRVTTPRNQAATKMDKQKMQPAGRKRKSMAIGTSDNKSQQRQGSNKEIHGDQDVRKTSAGHGIGVDDMDDPRKVRSSSTSPPLFRANFNHPDKAIDDLKLKIVSYVVEFEKHEPWKKVFPSTLPLPFDEVAHPDLAQTLRQFWRRYARTAWERNFWMPLRTRGNEEEIVLRRSRQRNAVTMFERFALACFERFGAKFFYKLDRKLHPGWWYRNTCVDLLGLSAIVGYDKCIEYVETQQYSRFPDCGHPLPLQSANIGVVQLQLAARDSQALWLQSSKPQVQEVRTKFVAYQAKKERKKLQKRVAKQTEKHVSAHDKVIKGAKQGLVNVNSSFDGEETEGTTDKSERSVAADEEEMAAVEGA